MVKASTLQWVEVGHLSSRIKLPKTKLSAPCLALNTKEIMWSKRWQVFFVSLSCGKQVAGPSNPSTVVAQYDKRLYVEHELIHKNKK